MVEHPIEGNEYEARCPGSPSRRVRLDAIVESRSEMKWVSTDDPGMKEFPAPVDPRSQIMTVTLLDGPDAGKQKTVDASQLFDVA